MKIEEVRELGRDKEVLACIGGSFVYEKTIKLLSHVDALIDLWEAAQEVIRTCGGLPGTEVLHEIEKALEKLEAVE